MSALIALSQGARICSIWAKKQTTKQIFLTLSVLAYTALLANRESKISKYYDTRNRTNDQPANRSGQNR